MSFNHVFSYSARSHLVRVFWLGVVIALAGSVTAQAQLTTPQEFFGHEIKVVDKF